MRQLVQELEHSLHKYISYLKEKNQEVQRNHQSILPIHSGSADSYTVIKRTPSWKKPEFISKFKSLDSKLDE